MTRVARGLFGIALICAAFLTGCSNSQTTSAPPRSSEGFRPSVLTQLLPAASVELVSFKGAPPKLKPLDMTQDPGCPSSPQPPDVVAVNAGKLANVFIYVKEGLPQGTFAVPSEPVVLDQKGCRYHPHMLGIMAGQPLKVLNSDTADHNIHDMPQSNPPWNESQSPTSKPIVKTFANPEMMIPVQCNQHPWMRAYINVMPHPYFAVSADDGTFAIKNLPPGEYTLVAVHEKFGEQTMKVKVGPKETVKAGFVFSAAL